VHPIYIDKELTGTSRARPGLDQALAAVREGDTLTVTKLDRLARSVPDALDILGQLSARGVRFALGGSVYDWNDPFARMFLQILAVIAEFEANLIRQRRHQAADLHRRIDPALPARPHMLADQVAQAGALRQRHHRHQPRPRHKIRVIKRYVRLRQAMQQSHLTGVLSGGLLEDSDTPIVPAQRTPFMLTRPNKPLYAGGFRLSGGAVEGRSGSA